MPMMTQEFRTRSILAPISNTTPILKRRFGIHHTVHILLE